MVWMTQLSRTIFGVHRLLFTHITPSPHIARFHVAAVDPNTQFHEIQDSTTERIREIAYMKTNGPKDVGVVYIPGFMAHKGGAKAVALHSFTQQYGFPYVRYDPSGMGESKGIKPSEALLSMWLEDAAQILQHVTEGPQIVVASSMGNWISCLLANRMPEKFKCIVMLAPAVNFHERLQKVLFSHLPPEALKKYKEGEIVKLYAPDYGEFPVNRQMFEAMEELRLSMGEGDIKLKCPVRIIHGMKDTDVPHLQSLDMVSALQSKDVHLTYLKESGHTLTDRNSLQVIFDTILKLDHQLHHPQS